MQKLEITVILPILNEDENIVKVVEELNDVLKSHYSSYEILGINTPDREGTFEILEKLGERFEHFYPINMKYVGGKRKVQKGYQYQLGFIIARGKIIVHMDSDYEDDPRDIPNMTKKIEEGYDLVVGWRTKRKHTYFYKLTSKVYNFVANSMTGIKLHDKNCGIKAYRSEAAKALNLHGENFRGIPLLLQAKGYRITEIPVNNRQRLGGKGHFGFWTRFLSGIFDLPSNIIISKTGDMPFRFWGMVTYLCVGLGFILFGLYMYFVLFTEMKLEVSLIFLSLFILLMIVSLITVITGIIMEYILEQKPLRLSEYTILDDPKERMKN